MAKSREDRADALRMRAIELEKMHPEQALELYKKAVREFQDTWTVQNYILNDIIELAERNNRWWDDAIEAAELAAVHNSTYCDMYKLRAEELRLKSLGRHYEALELECQEVLSRMDSSDVYSSFGRMFAAIEDPRAHDRAWRLYNEAVRLAVRLAVKEGQSAHYIRRDMAGMLLQEGKANAAIEMLITGICESKESPEGIPNVFETELRKALRESGINLRLKAYRDLPKAIMRACKEEGREAATRLVSTWKQAGGPPSE